MILWKDSVDGPVQTYKLNTVTTCAPYLATRTIQQLARDEGEHYPLAASVTIRDIYMDDILTETLGSQIREWDEPLSNPIAKEWNDFVSTLPVIQNIHVPRLVIGKGRIIIHGFADASTAAYGVVLYAQSISEEEMYLQDSYAANPVLHRFLHNSRNPSVKRSGQLDYSEVNEAELCLIKNLQATAFQEEIEFLAKSSCNSKKGKFFSLNPFLDGNQILRALKLCFIVQDKDFGHFVARKIVHECVVCFKNKPIVANQLMGSLPRERVNPSFPFLHTGIDYCGPFFIRYKHQRKGTYQKIYVAIFVCLASKAVHLEIVSDLTTDAFLATLKCFVARRGKCATISSDNAKNFVGANRELKRLHNLLKFPEEKLSSYLSSEGISWNFMPPRAPNFGGLWEAGVKSFKFYLKRAVGNLKMTLEEFVTIITQIEGILNSRPITPLSEDIDDLEVLTPGHFLIGRPITSISEPNLLDKTENTLSRWQKLTKIVQHIWTKWSRDYLNNLQQRNKWQYHKDNVKLNKWK
ncbi:integrase catalytic domain-containing protein [Trichonephila clavipes]|nr:integrase catalytic domain-containing protein [Trichonephila clavipes]